MEKFIKSTNVIRIYDRLKQSALSIEELHQWVEENGIQVSRRTLYRYLNDLEISIKHNGEKLVVAPGEQYRKVWKIEGQKNGYDELPKPSDIWQKLMQYLFVNGHESKSLDGFEAISDIELEIPSGISPKVFGHLHLNSDSFYYNAQGNMVLKVQAPISENLVGFILAMQSQVKVLAPAALRSYLPERIQSLMMHHLAD